MTMTSVASKRFQAHESYGVDLWRIGWDGTGLPANVVSLCC